MRQALLRIGLDAELESLDFATYVTRVYTDRAFDITLENLTNTFDPTIGVQRVFWSRNFKIGLPFSNASHYQNPEVDRLLEASRWSRTKRGAASCSSSFSARCAMTPRPSSWAPILTSPS
ncbi:hypothetical protein WJ970_05985 [Achromobacter xylosoxidans]